jgi:CobQ-like glutamine amidotransferase family enzyme
MKIRIAALFPDHLDLNGDQANLKVAKARLEWLGYEVEIIPVHKGDQVPAESAMVFLGHGSIAAWADIDSELRAQVPKLKAMIQEGVAFMAVASGHERAIELGFFPGKVAKRERISKFELTNLNGLEVLGYLNSETDAPIIQKSGLLLGTQLHGPLFAKNPKLVDAYFAEIIESRNIGVGSQVSQPDSRAKIDFVSAIVDQVWSLEKQLASE